MCGVGFWSTLYHSPFSHCSQSALNNPEMVWSNQNQSSTVAVLCPSPLHCHQYKWTRFESGEVRKFDDYSLRRKADRRRRLGDWESTPCALQSSFLPGPSSSCLENLQWAIALCDWHPTQATLLITFVQQNWVRRRWTGTGETELAIEREKKKSLLIFVHLHPSIWFERADVVVFFSI